MPTIDEARESLKQLLDQARAGNTSVLPMLRRFFELPGHVERYGGNLANDAMRRLVQLYAGKDLVTREAILHKLHEIRSALIRDRDNPSRRKTCSSTG
jgi:hypothetical protein